MSGFIKILFAVVMVDLVCLLAMHLDAAYRKHIAKYGVHFSDTNEPGNSNPPAQAPSPYAAPNLNSPTISVGQTSVTK